MTLAEKARQLNTIKGVAPLSLITFLIREFLGPDFISKGALSKESMDNAVKEANFQLDANYSLLLIRVRSSGRWCNPRLLSSSRKSHEYRSRVRILFGAL
jgi:hypothetical protein